MYDTPVIEKRTARFFEKINERNLICKTTTTALRQHHHPNPYPQPYLHPKKGGMAQGLVLERPAGPQSVNCQH